MKIVFRVDASQSIGTGHVMRCLTLANELRRDKNVYVSFICQELPANLCDYLIDRNYEVYQIPHLFGQEDKIDWERDAEQTVIFLSTLEDVDWLIVDHYQLDYKWEKRIKEDGKANQIMVIDDLANRIHDCDLLLDQNYYRNMNTRYAALVPASCRQLLGPSYTLLRPEFYIERDNVRERTGEVQRILLFFGGSDPTGETMKALQALEEFLEITTIQNEGQKILPFFVDVIVGSSNPVREKIKERCIELSNKYSPGKLQVKCYCQVNNMAEFIRRSDLAVGAGGVTTWERCYLGLPTVTIAVADNQIETTSAVEEAGAIRFLGWYEEVTAKKIAEELYKLIQNPGALRMMSQKAFHLMEDAKQMETGMERVIQVMKEVAL